MSTPPEQMAADLLLLEFRDNVEVLASQPGTPTARATLARRTDALQVEILRRMAW